MDNVNISKINIKIGKKEISLTLEAAKELQRILNDIFGDTVFVPNCPITIPYTVYPCPSYPSWEFTWATGTAVGTGGETLTCALVE